MSASNKKKLRKQEAEAQLTDRQKAASKEAKKQKNFTLTFWIVIALCVAITLGAVLTNPVKNVVYRNVIAVEVGDHELTAVELNYFYVDAISQFYSNYQSYISYLLNVKAPLNQQVYDSTTGQTWADYFVTLAHTNIKSTYAVYDLAVADNFTLTDDYKTAMDSTMMYLSLYASIYGFKNVDAYLQDMYGPGATEESYRAYYEKCLIAEAYYTKYAEDLEYTADQLTAYQKDTPYEFNSYTYATYYLAANRFYPEGAGTKGEDGKITYSKEEIAAAVEAAKAAADLLASGNYADLDAFDKAINELDINKEASKDDKDEDKTDNTTDGDDTTGDDTTGDDTTGDDTTGDDTTGDDTTGDDTTGDDTTGDNTTGDDTTDDDKEDDKEETKKSPSVKYDDVLYSSVNSLFRDWVAGKLGVNEDGEATIVVRKEGDLAVFESSTGTGEDKTINGYYVIRFGSATDNEFAMKNVRHLLVKFQKLDSNGKPVTNNSSNSNVTYTPKEKEAAKKEAEELLAEWLKGDATEETFIELVKKNSDDNAEAGGLYENVYPGQMVEAFENWCYDESREVGDYEIIETEYGYHIMYFVGDTEQTYRDYLITETMRAEDVQEWYTGVVEAMPLTSKSEKYINKETTMA